MNEAALTIKEVKALRDFLDREAILAVVNNYYRGLDTRDFALFETVFAEDAELCAHQVNGAIFKFEGLGAIIDALSRVNVYRTSHHGVRNAGITIEGNRATTNIYAMDALIDGTNSSENQTIVPRLIQHGLRYMDVLEKQSAGWRIKSRRIYTLWQVITANPRLLDKLPMPR